MLRARPDPKEWRPPVALCHGFALQKWSASRQNFQEGGPRTFPVGLGLGLPTETDISFRW